VRAAACAGCASCAEDEAVGGLHTEPGSRTDRRAASEYVRDGGREGGKERGGGRG
jgi:hypothetical protein